ncbi:MFS transporter [Bradyrhizobium sp. CB82]|uniref:MFS transporter n=1 Tax=Bradyrhizobium sp. CB82 TaxID=3039159 RepID=UPI0024B1C84F|nr:MFS transporter [Bradyrhizobium sp. CB82]WFU41593.1 MFS transporter [Bradyrhizobium sp. CB82]
MAKAGERVPGRRWLIGCLLGVGILVNYIDRVGLSAATPALSTELGLTATDIGLLGSAFFWTYSLLQIPGGMALDRFGVTAVGRASAFLWAVASAITALASGLYGIVAARMLLGVAEAPAFPASQKATGHWFPIDERARSTAIFDSAAKFSNVFGVPLVAFVIFLYGWRWGFGITAILSLAYFIAYYIIYRNPSEDPNLSRSEHAYIIAGGGTPEGPAPAGQSRMLGYLLGRRKVWGLTIGFSAYGYTFYLFLTWLPGYLAQTMHMNLMSAAGYSTIPWIFATLADLLIGGFLVDHLIARGYDSTRVRQMVIIVGGLMGLAVIGAAFTVRPGWALLWLSISISGLSATSPVGSSIVSLIAPKGGTGTVGGILNFTNNMMGALAPIVTGIVVDWTQSFAGAFLIAGVVLVVGIFFYVVVLGRIEPIADLAEEVPEAVVAVP